MLCTWAPTKAASRAVVCADFACDCTVGVEARVLLDKNVIRHARLGDIWHHTDAAFPDFPVTNSRDYHVCNVDMDANVDTDIQTGVDAYTDVDIDIDADK